MATGQVQLQHLGFLGIFKEAYKIIFSSWKDRLLPIFLTLVMPFCIVFTAEQYIASHLLKKIISYHTDLYDAWTYDSHYHELKQKIVTEWIIYVGLNTVFFLTGVVVFCLFSVSAIAYTVGCIYISFDATFKQVMRFVISRAWTRVMITFLWYFVILAIFNMIGVGVLVIGIFVITSSYQLYFFGIIVEVIILILYVSGIVYIGMIWHTASSISVLENKYYGLNALERSRSLLKGKRLRIQGNNVIQDNNASWCSERWINLLANGFALGQVKSADKQADTRVGGQAQAGTRAVSAGSNAQH
ncbi:hypothetical protein Sjap_018430 [Stephania japonica]|uniref:Uncharacterized protein n=1 Tax=Stephania japonica TaxID=461633 RepID=A0AAP0I840_9MAGN